MTLAGRGYRLAKRNEWHDTLAIGAEFNGSARRDERWRTQSIVKAKG